MTTKIFSIYNNVEGLNGKWYSKESLQSEIPESVKVLDCNNDIELGIKTRDEFIALVESSTRVFGYVNADFGDMSYLASVFGADEDYKYIYSANLF